MKNYFISVNQFAEFSKSTIASKRRIIKQQQYPNKFLIPWYQKAKSAMKKYLVDINDATPIEEAILILQNKVPVNHRQTIDRRVSIEALNELKTFAFPKMLRDVEFEMLKPFQRTLSLNKINIKVAPDVILRGVYNGKVIYGAVKIHISKTKPFDERQSRFVSNLIYKFLQKEITEKDAVILPELCLCLDIFGGRITSALLSRGNSQQIKSICEELKKMWNE